MTSSTYIPDYSSITTQQPDDTLNSLFDERTFAGLDSMLSTHTESSNTQIGLISESNEDLSLSFDLLLKGNQEMLFDEFQLMNSIESPINEVTVTSTNLDSGTIQETDDRQTSIDPNITILDNLSVTDTLNRLALEIINESIRDRAMVVEIQPPKTLHPRYASDGKRQIEKSRTNPMVIKLPALHEISKTWNVIFLLRLALITYNEDQAIQTYFHVNQLEYHSDDVCKLKDGTICVPVSNFEIANGIKKLPRLSIIKEKLSGYRSELQPFQWFTNDEQMYQMDNEHKKMSAKEAKRIYQIYNLKASRIRCQLLIKQNDTIFGTNIVCETDVLEQNPTKRSANDTDSEYEDEQHPIKRKKTI